MKNLTNSGRAPRLAAWLVELFASADHAEALLGDLSEEFLEIASTSGVISARHWYRRQTAKTIAHLAGAAFRLAPWSLAGAVLLGFVLRRLGLTLPERIIVALLRIPGPYSNLHYDLYMWLLTWGMPIVRVAEMTLIGCTVAAVAKGKEIVATSVVIIASSVLFGLAIFLRVPELGLRIPIPWLVLQAFENWTAILLGGVLIRTVRSFCLRRHFAA